MCILAIPPVVVACGELCQLPAFPLQGFQLPDALLQKLGALPVAAPGLLQAQRHDPLLQKLIGAYDADYPIAQREEAGTNAPTEV